MLTEAQLLSKRQRLLRKEIVMIKILKKKHLSPSRRRALRPFFLQSGRVCKSRCRPSSERGPVTDWQLHSVQSFAKK
ncbi:hypothetical protein C4K02_0358 [Pseudomonas synxantha]|nr:hypothetical protein C4K02_0358 [Pseudomonas synxantha]